MKRHLTEKREQWAIGAIVALAAFLRFFRLGHQSLWTDELISIGTYTSPPDVSYWRKILWDVHGPFYSFILHFWSALSSSTVWLRAPSAAAGVLSVFLIYRWLVAIGKRDMALTAALFMALSPFNLYYSQELRFYSQLALFVLISLIVFERFLANPSYGRGAVLGVTLALTCLSHFSGGFLCGGLLVYLAVKGRLRGRYLRSGALAAIIVLIIIAPWIYREITFLRGIRVTDVSSIPVSERYRGELTLSLWSYPYALYAFSVGYSFGPDLRELHLISSPFELVGKHGPALIITVLLFGSLFISGLVRSARGGHIAFFLSILMTAVLMLYVITKYNVKVFNVRYLISTFPVFIALIAYGLPKVRWANYALAGAVCAVMLVSDWNYHTVGAYARDDIKGAVKIIEDFENEGDLILVPGVAPVFEHYYKGSNRVADVFPGSLDEEGLRKLIRENLKAHGRIWYLRCRHWYSDPNDMLIDVLSSETRKAGAWELSGVVLILYKNL